MEQEIKRVSSRLRLLYFAFWLLAILIVVLCECMDGFVGRYASNPKAVYLAETVVILLTILTIPVSLKFYARMLTNKIDKLSIDKALKAYCKLNCLRLALLAIPMLVGLFVYYQMLSNTGVLCALIALCASLFCVPSEKRLRQELFIQIEGTENNEE